MFVTTVLVCAVFVGSLALTSVVRRFAVSREMLDIPNERSSHAQATPRGGGIAIVVMATVGFLALALLGTVSYPLFLALSVGGLAIALVGYLDDRHKLTARTRLAVHWGVGVWAVVWVRGLAVVEVGGHLVHLGWLGTALSVLGVVWVVNLFNFMDGIDGIATAEALCVAGGGGLLVSLSGADGLVAAAWVFAGACAGFLCWNWPPARIFLGDVGSGYLGYVIIVLALADAQVRPAAIWTWFTLGGVFFVDATLTLLRRLFRGERVHEAHRQHAYQRLARRCGSHKAVTSAVIAINFLWLFPVATLTQLYPGWAISLAAIGAIPLLLTAIALGAGRRQT